MAYTSPSYDNEGKSTKASDQYLPGESDNEYIYRMMTGQTNGNTSDNLYNDKNYMSWLYGGLGALLQDTPFGNLLSGYADRLATAEEEEKTRLWNYALFQEQNQFAATEAQKQRDWEEQMSNTAIQRQMADLNNAGLNPWLAAGGGASTPGGAAAASTTAQGGKRVNVNMFMDAAKQNHKVIKDVVDSIGKFMGS